MNKYEPLFHPEKLREAQQIAFQECSKGPNTLDRHIAALAAAGAKLSTPIMQDTPLATQVGGRHYKDMKIQPVEYIHANNIGYFEGNVIKYVSRWREKGGVADLEKAKHYIDLLIELEGKKN